MKKIVICIILGIVIGLSLNLPIKKGMQVLISKNYKLREEGKILDEWYWVDKLYFKWYGDYDFYE